MATIFPGSASVGQIFDGYSFNGTAWDIVGIDLTADYLEESSASATYLTQVSASNTYLTQTSASTIYQPKVANISDTEIGYLNGVTSSIQTQLDDKSTASKTETLTNKTLTTPTINGPAITAIGQTPTIHGIYLPAPHNIIFEGTTANEFETTLEPGEPTADRTITLPDQTGTVQLRVTDVSDTEIGYLNGVTSAIQTQIDSKLSISSASTTYATKTELNNIDLSSASAAAVAAIVDSAPATLDTLNELAAALGDDANYASTITTALGNKLNISSASTTYATKDSPTFTGTVVIPTLDLTNPLNPEDGGTGLNSLGSAGYVLKVNSGANALEWGSIAGAVYQENAPISPQVGDVWVDSNATASVLNTNDFLLKADASASSGYLLKTDASASSGYLLKTDAASTYVTKIEPGTVAKVFSTKSNLTQAVYGTINYNFYNQTYTTNSKVSSKLLITFGVAYECNLSGDSIQLAVSLDGTDEFKFSDTAAAAQYNEMPFYTFISTNSYAPGTTISNLRVYIKAISGNVVCPRDAGTLHNFYLTVQEIAQ